MAWNVLGVNDWPSLIKWWMRWPFSVLTSLLGVEVFGHETLNLSRLFQKLGSFWPHLFALMIRHIHWAQIWDEEEVRCMYWYESYSRFCNLDEQIRFALDCYAVSSLWYLVGSPQLNLDLLSTCPNFFVLFSGSSAESFSPSLSKDITKSGQVPRPGLACKSKKVLSLINTTKHVYLKAKVVPVIKLFDDTRTLPDSDVTSNVASKVEQCLTKLSILRMIAHEIIMQTGSSNLALHPRFCDIWPS